MEADLQLSLEKYLLSIADDELILAHRNSEWCGHAPIIEEDIAFANIALDEMGHAIVWYQMIADLKGEDIVSYPDLLAFSRDPKIFRNIQMVELPKGDWAFSILRQYFFDMMEIIRLKAFSVSSYPAIYNVAKKISMEENYHLRHTSLWLKRLALGTDESHNRIQNALNTLWKYALQMFQPAEYDLILTKEALTPDLNALREEWSEQVMFDLKEYRLYIPKSSEIILDRQQHTHHLYNLITEMQSVSTSNPRANW